MKRFIAIFICVMMLCSLFPATYAGAFEDERHTESLCVDDNNETGSQGENGSIDDNQIEQTEPVEPVEAAKVELVEPVEAVKVELVEPVEVGSGGMTEPAGIESVDLTETLTAENTGLETEFSVALMPIVANYTLTSTGPELLYSNVSLPFSEASALSDFDGVSSINGAYARGYSFNSDAGMEVTITLRSDAFDAYLFLLDESGNILELNDDGDGGTNSRIVFKLPYTGTYYVEAAQFPFSRPGSTGSFEISISVSEASEPDDPDGIIIWFATLDYPEDLFTLETGSDPRNLEAELEYAALVVYGMIRFGHFIIVPVEWRYDEFDSSTPGIRMIVGDIFLPDGYIYEDGELTVESPVLVYDPDGEPLDTVYDFLQYVFTPRQKHLIPLGMTADDVEAQLSEIPDAILIETTGGYRLMVDISIDTSIVDSSTVGAYYPVTLHLPPGIGFNDDDYLKTFLTVYVIDRDEVDLSMAHVWAGYLTISWLKKISDPELWFSVDGGEWCNIFDGTEWFDWVIWDGYEASYFDQLFSGIPQYTELNISFDWLFSGHIYDFEVRYEDGGVSANILRLDLTGDNPKYYPYEGDRTGGDRYGNPWDVIIGDGNGGGNGNGGDGNGSGNGGGDNDDNGKGGGNDGGTGGGGIGNGNGGGNGSGSGNGNGNNDNNGGGGSGNDGTGNGNNSGGDDPTIPPATEPDPPGAGSNNNYPEATHLSNRTGVSNITPQPPQQQGTLILEPTNPISPVGTPAESDNNYPTIGSTEINDNPVPMAADTRAPLIPDVLLPNPLSDQSASVSSFPILLVALSIIGAGGGGAGFVYFFRQRKVYIAR